MIATKRKFTLIAAIGVAAVCSGQVAPSQSELVRFSSQAVAKPEVGPISVVDPQHIWVGLSYTADGGTSWIGRFPPEDSHQFEHIPPGDQTAIFANGDRGWLSGLGRIWATNDAGITWSSLFSGVGVGTLGFSGTHGWIAVGDDRSTRNYITQDLGATWTQCGMDWDLLRMGPFSRVSFVDDRNGWISVAKFDSLRRPLATGVARTEDGGCIWKILWWDPVRWEKLFEIHFVDRSFGWMGADREKLLETRDGGLHWKSIRLPRSDFYLEGLHLIDRQRGWVLGSPPPGLYYTADGGTHWHVVSDSDLRQNLGGSRQIPPSWGDGLLVKLRAAHGQN
jgi:photosystem II stability/assembly factor-like uncharacterized protein